MSILLDIIIVAIVIVTVVFSARKGFMHSIASLAGHLALLSVSLMLSTGLANITYRSFVEPQVEQTVRTAISQSAEATLDTVIDKVYDDLPQAVTGLADSRGLSKQQAVEQLTSKAEYDLEGAAVAVVNMFTKPLVTSVFTVIFLIIAMILGGFVVKLFVKLVDKVFSFSVVGKVNSFLGGVLGVAKGLLFAAVFVWIVSIAVATTGGMPSVITADIMDATVIFRFLSQLNPVV